MVHSYIFIKQVLDFFFSIFKNTALQWDCYCSKWTHLLWYLSVPCAWKLDLQNELIRGESVRGEVRETVQAAALCPKPFSEISCSPNVYPLIYFLSQPYASLLQYVLAVRDRRVNMFAFGKHLIITGRKSTKSPP